MKTLGLTGGIGAGKSSVALLFQQKNIPVFDSDREAKKLYKKSPIVKQKVIALLGDNAYKDDEPNKSYIAEKVFQNQNLLESLNAIIHPALQSEFEQWKESQHADFVVKEAAILFESGAYKQCDAVLTITAEQAIRIERVMQRDHLSHQQILKRIENQWPEQRKIELSDFVITNDGSPEDLKNAFDSIYPDIYFRMSPS